MSVADTAFFIRTDISFVFAREENFLECCFFLLSFTRDRIDVLCFRGDLAFGWEIFLFFKEYVFFVWFVYIYCDSVHMDNFKI